MDGKGDEKIIVRELITRLGFKVDEKGIKKGKRAIAGFKKAAKIAAIGIVAGLVAIGVGAVKAAADMEMLTTQFEVMLGSTEKANAMMEKLTIFSAKTPFQLPDLAQGTQTLLSFGIEEENVIDRMRMLGDAALGNTEKLKGLILAYGKVKTKGKVSMEEINMIAEKGVPIIKTLSDQLGVTKTEFFKLVSAGKIGEKEVTKAFQTMTSEGGIFFKGMEKASGTLTGMISTLKDVFNLLLAGIGKELIPVMKEFVGVMIGLLEGPLKEIGKGLSAVLVPLFKALGKILPTIIKFLVPILEAVGGILGKLLLGLVPVFDLLEPILIIIEELMPLLEVIVELIVMLIPLIVFVLKVAIKLMNLFIRPMIKIMVRALRLINRIVEAALKGLKTVLKGIRSIIQPIKNIITSIGDFFRNMWNSIANSINKAIESFNRLSPGTKFDIAARLPTISAEGAMRKEAEGMGAGTKNITTTMQNKIDVKVSGGAGGATPGAIGQAVASKVQSVFALELKKVLISAV